MEEKFEKKDLEKTNFSIDKESIADTDESGKAKPRVVFAFVEAGMGHIMPLNAVYNAFNAKYGDKVNVIKTFFYQDKHDPKMEFVERELVKEVKLHNKHKIRGIMQCGLMGIFGTRISMGFLMRVKYGKGYQASVDYLKELAPDMLVNSHFATLYCACQSREQGLLDCDIVTYCPDHCIPNQWDNRGDLLAISCQPAMEKAVARKFYKPEQLAYVPFLIRNEAKACTESKEFYRNALNLIKDNFTVLLVDGAYGAAKLEKTTKKLLKSDKKMTVISACGKNEKLYNRLKELEVPQNIQFVPLSFTDKMAQYFSAADIFVGKGGANMLGESAYFGTPAIITYLATPLERDSCAYYANYVKSAVLEQNIKKAVKLIETWSQHPELLDEYRKACIPMRRDDGPEVLADILWERLKERQKS